MILDSVDLKALIVSRGIKVSNDVYSYFSGKCRLYRSPLCCNCIILPDGVIIQMTDLKFHISYLKTAMSFDNLKQIKYLSSMQTHFTLEKSGDNAAIFYKGVKVTDVTFPEPTGFYSQKTSSGMPFIGNAVIQGTQWLAFQCLWPCDYACAGNSCQFCYSGGVFESMSKKKKKLPAIPSPDDFADIVNYITVKEKYCDSIQITGGSSFDSDKERALITSYMEAIKTKVGRENIKGEILLYITPPKDYSAAEHYFSLGADRIACSLEVWDKKLAAAITPGKVKYTGREAYVNALKNISDKHGAGKAFCNFIIGLEPFESLAEGAQYLAQNGIIPSASVWIPFGRPVMGSVTPPDIDYYQKVKKLFAELYDKYSLEPAGASGLNVCIERDIWTNRKAILNP